ncbi:MAG: DUF1080 domain-containing protein [Planctomycetaceae bacterium]
MKNSLTQSLICLSLLTVTCLVQPACAFADDADAIKEAYLDAESAGKPFAIQGEYSGEVKTQDGPMKLGVQVMAQGRNELAFAAWFGGLPGDGWNGEGVLRGKGEMTGETATLTGEHGRGEIKDGNLTIYDADNNLMGELQKIERKSPTLGAKPPEGAVVLFDGTTADQFENGRLSEDNLLMEGVTSKDKFQDFQLHLEFRLAFMPNARGQARSNSGCYLQGRYEVQILDSFGLTGEDNECGGIYKASKPDLNMCLPPLAWQTYDIEFHAAKFDAEGKKISNARATVKHNGVAIHTDREIPGGTPGGPVRGEGAEEGPIFLQNHGDPLRFRNIWVKPL